MQIDSFARIVRGELLNSPSVNLFKNISFDAKNIKRGDLFIAFNEGGIEEAILNGAYAILFSFEKKILDNEIAWIKTKDINNSLARYLRYFLIQKVKSYYLDEIEIALLKEILVDKNLLILQNDIINDFKSITKKSYKFLISNNEDFLKLIEPHFLKLEIKNIKFQILNSSLFKTTLLIDKNIYKNLKIPKLYLESLFRVISFLKEHNLEYKLDRLNYINHFHPVYINEKFQEVDFGKSQKVLIFTKKSQFLDKEIEFLKENTKWGKIIIYSTKNYIKKDELEKLCHENFNFALIVAKRDDFIFSKSQKEENSLFE